MSQSNDKRGEHDYPLRAPHTQNGNYVENSRLGSFKLDGMQFSNNLEPEATVVLPHRLLVEGNPANFVKLQQHRPAPDICVHSAVCSPPQTHAKFLTGRGVRGRLWRHLPDVGELCKEMAQRNNIRVHVSTTEVQCAPMSNLLADTNLTHSTFSAST